MNKITFDSGLLLARVRVAAAAGVKQTADEAAATMRRMITQDPKSGTVYEDGHQSSAPGESPADWHHDLLGSIGSEMTGATEAVAYAGGAQAPYLAEFLEYGSPNGRIAARPLVTPVAEQLKQIAVDNVARALREALK